MKIGINGYEAVVPRFGFDEDGIPNRVGSSEVCFQLLNQLSKIDSKNSYIIYVPFAPTSDMPKETGNWKYTIVHGKRLWTLFALKNAVNQDRLDIFFNPSHYSPFLLNCPQVITILDVSYKYFPELFKKKDLYKLSLWGKYSVKAASKILTISENSKGDIIKEYGVLPSKIAVIHLGIKDTNMSKMSKEEILEKYNIKSPFVLFVGTIQPRKNIKKLIQAFSMLTKEDKETQLVIVGKKGWMYEDILNSDKEFGIEDRVQFLHDVSNEDLPFLYKTAGCFVLPSLYEGFGLPVLEAMRFGCPVITSNISSLPEAGGDAALYVDPNDAEDIARAIKKVLTDEAFRSEMIKKGHEQVKKFSWDKAAMEVIRVFEDVAGK